MSELKQLGGIAVMVGLGFFSTASCKHNDGPMPASPGGGTADGGSSAPIKGKGHDDTTTGEPIGPLTSLGAGPTIGTGR